MMKLSLFVLVSFLALGLDLVNGHGMLLEPVGRASRWRYDASAPADYDDNQGYCGGFFVQYNSNGGNCGLCGDNYQDSTPRRHEHGGQYGQGVIVKRYPSGSIMPVSVKITTNHKGHFRFHLCNMDGQRETEECYQRYPLQVQGGGFEYRMTEYYAGMYDLNLVLPQGVRCNHCVLRWAYVAANTWGACGDGTSATGCGPQEEFRSCSDIAIY